MKLSTIFDRFIKKKSPPIERLFSLVIDELCVQSAIWFLGERGNPVVTENKIECVDEDSWEARLEAADKALSALSDDETFSDVHKVVLGLSSRYLTPTGDIDVATRSEVKKLCRELDLIPIGFVSIPAAIVHKMKIEEGIPPTIILLCLSNGACTVSIYKVGLRVAEETITVDDVVIQLEETLKKLKDTEVLPSRILLYGTDEKKLEQIQHTLLKHPWPTRVSFLHFPKIDLLPLSYAAQAVSLAGSQETGATRGFLDEGKSDIYKASETKSDTVPKGEDENIVAVGPEELGFRREDVLVKMQKNNNVKHFMLPKLPISNILRLRGIHIFDTISLPSLGIPIAGVVVATCFIFGLYMWFLPKAVVTILVLPKKLEEKIDLTVLTTATVADVRSRTVPGKMQEKVVSGEKEIPVTSKKEVGDPAKGSVIVYNKATSERALKKGMQITAGNLIFSIDDDVKIASASESIGSVTFGKGNVSVTAVAIGTKANLPAGTEFTFKDIPTSVAIARNDQPFTGGASREVTVVSRVDYDALTKGLTRDLVEKAKGELSTNVSGREKLIDATIASIVTDKAFQEELDQEADVLHGKITVTVTGISYNEEDIRTIFEELVNSQIPPGFELSTEQTLTKITEVKVKKDKTIGLSATMKATATPILSTRDIADSLAGKSIAQAAEYLRTINGVGGVEVSVRWSLLRNRLPMNQDNISVSIALQE